MINSASATKAGRGSAPESLTQRTTSTPVLMPQPMAAEQPATIVRTHKRTSGVTAQKAPDPRSHAGQRRINLNEASFSGVLAALATGDQAVESLGRVIGIITTTVLVEVPAAPRRPHRDLPQNEHSRLAS